MLYVCGSLLRQIGLVSLLAAVWQADLAKYAAGIAGGALGIGLGFANANSQACSAF